MNIFPVIAVFALVFVAGCIDGAFPEEGNSGDNEVKIGDNEVKIGDNEVKIGDNEVKITDTGFVPETLTIDRGETVVFLNVGQRSSWPASDVHPTHGAYPEGGGCIGSAFDACKGLQNGDSYSFTFNEAGEWNYHDHLRPSMKGTITVE